MKKIIFSGFCMATSAIGIISMLFAAIQLEKQYGSINGDSSLMVYLNLLNLTPIFTGFIILGITGFLLRLWGIFEKDSKS
ncbi:MAG: hypothetical protein K0S04_2821 [Herbinix sp.]|nr:hypothetical protein [Herbinix sp.]